MPQTSDTTYQEVGDAVFPNWVPGAALVVPVVGFLGLGAANVGGVVGVVGTVLLVVLGLAVYGTIFALLGRGLWVAVGGV